MNRATKLRRLMNDFIRDVTPQERDRRMQVHLAEARGPVRNAVLLFEMIALLLRARTTVRLRERQQDHQPIVEVVAEIVKTLEIAGVEYAIVGSVACGIHGEPVNTTQADMIVRMTPQQAQQIAADLPPRFYRNEDSLVDAARNNGFVNLIDMDTSFKVDLSVVEATPFYLAVFERRHRIDFAPGGPSFDVVTPEDIILMKLVWRRDSRSVKQWENALSVARVQGARMDWKYLFEQAEALEIVDDLTKLRDEAGI